MKEKLSANDIAEYFLTKDSMTHKKLQKLVYYAYAWYIVKCNEISTDINHVLFEEQPQAWVHGPVFPSLYAKYKMSNWNDIPKLQEQNKIKDSKVIKFLNEVWEVFSPFDADQLETMTHQEDPWREARKGCGALDPSTALISNSTIFNYYGNL